MKLIIVLITLGLSISKNINDFMLVGFSDYLEKNETSSGFLNFSIHFIANSSFLNYTNTNISIDIQLVNGTLPQEINCNHLTSNMTNELKKSTYNCSYDFNKALPNITSVTPKINFEFYNNSNSTIYNVTEDKIDKSSIADTSINPLREQNESIIYDIFYLNKIEFLNDEFILKGNLSNNQTETYINLTLSETAYNASVTKDEIKFKPTEKIYDYLHGKMSKSANNGKYILIYAKNEFDDYLTYSTSKPFFKILDFGNYKEPSKEENATNQLYLTVTPHTLN